MNALRVADAIRRGSGRVRLRQIGVPAWLAQRDPISAKIILRRLGGRMALIREGRVG